MARSFFITPLICAFDAEKGVTRCAPKVNPQQVNFAAVCQVETAPDPKCLVLCAGDLSGPNNDAAVSTMVADNLDATISSLSQPERNRIQNALNSSGISVAISDYATVRDFLNAVGSFIAAPYPFSVDNLFAPGS